MTEAVTGLDIVRLQLLAAMGKPTGVDQSDVTLTGHAIEARLYAEDPASGFLPATGTLEVWEPAFDPAVRFDAGIEQGSVVGTEFDPLLAKVIAWAPTREEAASKLALALERTRLAGVTTNRDFLVATLRTDAFLDGRTTTDFIDREQPPATRTVPPADLLAAASVAALWVQGRNRKEANVLHFLPSGWQIGRLPSPHVTLIHGAEELRLAYRLGRDGRFRFDDGRSATVHHWSSDHIVATINGERFSLDVRAVGDRLHVHGPFGDISFVVKPRFPSPEKEIPAGSLVAPMPGTVIDVRVQPGEAVTAGQVLVVLEAMKMEHHIAAPAPGLANSVLVSVGDQVANGAPLLVLERQEH